VTPLAAGAALEAVALVIACVVTATALLAVRLVVVESADDATALLVAAVWAPPQAVRRLAPLSANSLPASLSAVRRLAYGGDERCHDPPPFLPCEGTGPFRLPDHQNDLPRGLGR